MQPQQGLFSQYSNPHELALRVMSMSPEELSKVDHTSLLMARKYSPASMQGELAPYEHQAYTREAIYDNPSWAPFLAAGAALYQPYKAMTGEGRSQPSMQTAKQGLKGVYEGLLQHVQEIGDSLAYQDPFGLTIK